MIPSLELRNLSRSWPGGPPVFRNLNLGVPSRGITVLLGPSGCGKSTLLRCAASLDTPQTGEVRVSGHPVNHPSPDRQLILQTDDQLLPWLTVEQNILFPRNSLMRARHRRSEQRSGNHRQVAEGLLDQVGLSGTGGRYPFSLSGGMRQRVVLARALAADPTVLLLDEPFAALDAGVRSRLQLLLRRIHEEQKVAMLLVTHDVGEALILGDHILYMTESGELFPEQPNPLGRNRDADSPEFHAETVRLRKRYFETGNSGASSR